jgi:hypothetical protein
MPHPFKGVLRGRACYNITCGAYSLPKGFPNVIKYRKGDGSFEFPKSISTSHSSLGGILETINIALTFDFSMSFLGETPLGFISDIFHPPGLLLFPSPTKIS